MSAIRLRIATPERVFFDGDAESVVLTSTEGELGVLAGHAPTVVALSAAPIKFRQGEVWLEAALSGGFAEIDGDRTLVFADTAEWPEEIEVNRALEAKRRAEERIRARRSEAEYIQSMIALQRALARLRVSERVQK